MGLVSSLLVYIFDTLHTHWIVGDVYSEFRSAFIFGILFVIFSLIGCFITSSPYGKLQDGVLASTSLSIQPNFGWFLMELPATLSFVYFFFKSGQASSQLQLFLAALWLLHYGNRGFFFPFSIRVTPGTKSNFSCVVVIVGWIFTSLHGYLSASWYGRVGQHLTSDWIFNPIFIVGLIGYQLSFWMTVHCEYIQRNLRSLKPKSDEPRYKIPTGGMFKYCSNPTYFFEITGWLFFALMTVNPGGLVVFLVTCVNLIPRAFQQHSWYLKTFGDAYPKTGKC